MTLPLWPFPRFWLLLCRGGEPRNFGTSASLLSHILEKLPKHAFFRQEVIKVFFASEQVRGEIYFGSCDHPKIGPEQQSRKIQTGSWD